jgi:hypothetical protein
MNDDFIYLVIRDDGLPYAAVSTEADAEELYMDLVMEAQYLNFLWDVNRFSASIKSALQRWCTFDFDAGYWITRAPLIDKYIL